MEYYGVVPGQNTRFSKITKWGVALLAVFMGWKGIQAGYWYYIPFALLLILFALYRKDFALSEKGVDMRRLFLVYTNHDLWSWDTVTHIIVDYEMMKPSAMILIARGDNKKRQFMMRAEDARAAVKLAQKKNPQIKVEIQDASGRHTEYPYNQSTRNERKAARAAASDQAKAGQAAGTAAKAGQAAGSAAKTGQVSGNPSKTGQAADNSAKAGQASHVEVPENFQDVKAELRRQQERAEQLKQYRRPDPGSARCIRPEKKLRGFR